MKIYDNYMNDFVIVLTYEFIQIVYPILYNIFLLIFQTLLFKLKKYLYIPFNKNLNLHKILLVYNNNIVLYDLINLNYYNIRVFINDRFVKIIGNNNYIMINYLMYKINNYDKVSRTLNNEIVMYKLPIKIYDKSECGICLINQGTLIGACGHQNICSECISKINKCPMCNNHILFNNLDPKIINYLQLA